MIVTETEAQPSTEALIYWNDLPDEYKNAIRISPDGVESKREVLPNNPYKQDEVFNPFNISAENFSLEIPSRNVKKIAIGKGKNGAVSHITFWYTTGHLQSILYVVSSGMSESTPMVTYTLSEGEYIKGFTGRSVNGGLRDLSIYTNKGYVSTGTNAGGTYFSYFSTPGSFIGKFSGNAGSIIGQLKATSYILPWQKVSSGSAREIAVGSNGTSYIADDEGVLFQMSNNATSWVRVTGAPAGVRRIAAYADILYVSTDKHIIHKRENNQWSSMFPTGEIRDIDVSPDGYLFAIRGNNGNLSCFLTNAWNQLTFGTSLENVSAGYNLDAKVVGSGGVIYPLGNYSNGLGNSIGTDGRDITGVGNQIWVTTRSGKIKVRLSNTWKEMTESGAVRIDAAQDKVMMVNTAGDVYQLEL